MVSSEAKLVADNLESFVTRAVEEAGGNTTPVAPSHRIPFHWPPHPISKDYHVLASDWTGRADIEVYGEHFDVQIARTAQGIFGRIEKVWNEAKGATLEEVLAGLAETCEPYFRRQFEIGKTLGSPVRYGGLLNDLSPSDHVKLLYCPDRDVAHEAQLYIESHASTGLFAPALISILLDQRHPNRRSAQWCVLDMFEDLPSFCPDSESQSEAVAAIKSLIWSANDDFARTIYKAGVVLGGHVCTPEAADAILDCVQAPSKFGRRSAIHASFHLGEWLKDYKDRILSALDAAAVNDPEVLLREFAASMARDIRNGAFDHMTEPGFPEER